MKKELTLEEIREIQINELLYVKDICDKNNINYYLVSGTLLGAVKYKGYIPWDDDIDIALDRSSYLKLIKLIEEDNHLAYKILTVYNTKDYYYPYAKLVNKNTKLVENSKEINDMGVFIDIFPMDRFNDDIMKIYKRTKFLRNISTRRMRIIKPIKKSRLLEEKEIKVKFHFIKSFVYSIIDIVSLPLGYTFWTKVLDKVLSKYKDGKYYCTMYLNRKNYFDVSLFDDIDEYEFEGYKFTSIKNYDTYLRKVYGDYLSDLPLSLQRTHHQMKAYRR